MILLDDNFETLYYVEIIVNSPIHRLDVCLGFEVILLDDSFKTPYYVGRLVKP